MTWEFSIDRGGTFTDCIGVAPDGSLHTAKLLSSESASVEGVRAILVRAGVVERGDALPACRLKLGTTVATNALLERRGVPTALVTNRGLGDVIAIGTQERRDLFDLRVSRVAPVHDAVAEVSGRVAVDGAPLEGFDADAARAALIRLREHGARSIAVVMIHAYAFPEVEQKLCDIARGLGFEYVTASHDVAPEIGLLARGETTTVDAYLTPLLRDHLGALAEGLPGSHLRFMQSSGGLTDAARFHGPTALLSGPAGGVVGAARVARQAGFSRAVGFDMGGTSTDVSLIDGGETERVFETVVAGIRVKAPMLRIHTVAAGGGSLCRFDGFRLTVGPESAGASPGPICYGGADARVLALTDVNLALGRVQPDRFPFRLRGEGVERALGDLRSVLAAEGHALSTDEIAAGFVDVANAAMAQAITQVSVARGVDPRECALVGFGGAAGQHVCAIARALGMRTVLLHPLAGILSAYGIGIAETSWDGQRDAGRTRLPSGIAPLPESVESRLQALEADGRAALVAEGARAEALRVERRLDLRYVGTESPLAVRAPRDGDWSAAFAAEHRARFGYERRREIEIVTARVGISSESPGSRDPAPLAPGDPPAPVPIRMERVAFPGEGRVETPVYERERLPPGTALAGPALVLEGTGTVVIDPGFRARVDPQGVLILSDETGAARETGVDLSRADPIRLEVLGNRFMSIAEQMGAVLRNTAVSTNIKDRLDYSCAVFDDQAGLVANAPHIPVHLGAMAETVRVVRERFPELEDGDVVVTNDPSAGGSHLPDVTAVTPVFVQGGEGPAFFVASRGHHADLGGVTPGSMPPDSQSLAEEGVVLAPFLLVRAGRLDEAVLRRALGSGPYPARSPDDNVADLEAAVAANRCGVDRLRALAEQQGLDTLRTTMRQLQEAAAGKVAREIGRLPDGIHHFEDQLDDGTPVRVSLAIDGERMTIDFSGTGAAVSGNLNAPRAVVQAAVIYVLRALVDERIPLNGGCLDPVEVIVPSGSLLDPPAGAAVVGGNVETSQRVVDVLLGAIGRFAASQGTMNNVTFGDETFGYYETIGGGAGAGADYAGASGIHTHMTNTRITDAEVLESRLPVRIVRFALRRGTGGAGRWAGGDGLERCFEFLAPVTASLLSERRTTAPFGLAGGSPGAMGRNRVERRSGAVEELPGKASAHLDEGDRLCVETPGGGGYGEPG
jgi:5-oxoprolinase (ATP-hydrolysing)